MATPKGVMQRFLGAVKVGRLYTAHAKGLTALAGGGQTGATQLSKTLNTVDTVATANDSVMLPACEESRILWVINNGAHSMQVYSQETSGVTINGTAGSTGVAQANGTAGRAPIAGRREAACTGHACGGQHLPCRH